MMISKGFRPLVTDLASSTGLQLASLAQLELGEAALKVMRRRMPVRSPSAVARLKSPAKKRYIVAPARYQQSAGANSQAGLSTIHNTLSENVLRSQGETGSKLLALSPLEAALVKERFPFLLVEEDIQHRMSRTPIPLEIEPIQVPASGGKTITLQVRGDGSPLPEARIVLFVDVQSKTGYEGRTGVDGSVKLTIRSSDTRFEKVVVLPKGGFWSRIWKDQPVSSTMRFDLAPLTVNGFDWGHVSTEASKRGQHYGHDVKVAIVDSGIGPHGSLNVVGGKNFILNEAAEAWQDQDGHGTHCAGVIAALEAQASVWGYVPQVQMHSLRVFGGSDGGGYASDIADAIDWAVSAGCDIVSLSLGSDGPSGYIRNSIEKASDAGVLCIAAVGNEGGEVQYPAKFRNVVGVSAIGKMNTFPQDSIHQEAQSKISSSDDSFFFASFSNRGEEVDLCAPGVAVTSTIPGGLYSAWDGTSMACPHVAGVAAVALDNSPEIRNAARDGLRTGQLTDRLLGLCSDLGMPKTYQGAGLPRLGKLFAA
jgi:minor extracellular protease Epr